MMQFVCEESLESLDLLLWFVYYLSKTALYNCTSKCRGIDSLDWCICYIIQTTLYFCVLLCVERSGIDIICNIGVNQHCT